MAPSFPILYFWPSSSFEAQGSPMWIHGTKDGIRTNGRFSELKGQQSLEGVPTTILHYYWSACHDWHLECTSIHFWTCSGCKHVLFKSDEFRNLSGDSLLELCLLKLLPHYKNRGCVQGSYATAELKRGCARGPWGALSGL
jgi:hypothetical protein